MLYYMKFKQEFKTVPGDLENSSGVGNFMPRGTFLIEYCAGKFFLQKFC